MTKEKRKIADYFMQQCLGGSDGHMATIPHNPNIKAFVEAFCEYRPSRMKFAEFLDEISASLKDIHKEEDGIPY